jgi:predicted short-subunit dehydrogenase-like oxidoreductase (DUF2520 family)
MAIVKKPSVAIVGVGRLGSAMLRELTRGAYAVKEIVVRDRSESLRKARRLAGSKIHVSTASTARLDADLVWVCVPDAEIANVAKALSAKTQWKSKLVFHSSGALAADELRVLRRKGATVASVHPFATFVHGAIPTLRGIPFGLEGDGSGVLQARRIVKDLGGIAFAIPKAKKTAYHAWGSFTSPLLIALLVTAEEVAQSAGVSRTLARKRMLPILHQTLRNYGRLGAEASFSGPIVRGDVETVRRHIAALEKHPEAQKVYVALAKAALKQLPAENKQKLKSVMHS